MKWNQANARRLVDQVMWPAVLGNILWGAVGESIRVQDFGSILITVALHLPFVAWLVAEELRGSRRPNWMPPTMFSIQAAASILAVVVVHMITIESGTDPQQATLYWSLVWLAVLLFALFLTNLHLLVTDWSGRTRLKARHILTSLVLLVAGLIALPGCAELPARWSTLAAVEWIALGAWLLIRCCTSGGDALPSKGGSSQS